MRLLASLLVLACALSAHVGSPDIYYDGSAGPYRLAVTVRPPQVIPGVAEIEIRSETGGLRHVKIVPIPLTGPGARFAPTADVAQPSREDPQFFTGSLWIMRAGSWRVRISASGDKGEGELSVPVPAFSARTLRMQRGMALVLLPLLVLLAAGLISIVGAGIREGQLDPGKRPEPGRIRRSRVAMAGTAGFIVFVLWAGNQWWNSSAAEYDRFVFKPLQAKASLEAGDRLLLQLHDPGWLNRRLDDFVPDHNHLVHMYVIRLPEMERVWHLHPELTGSAEFTQQLPPMPAGRYQIFADLVHESGLPETVTTELTLPAVAGKPLAGDDSTGDGPPLSQADFERSVAALPDGGRMVWERDRDQFETKTLEWFRFRVEDAAGQPVRDLELYMGMPGHAAFVRDDLSVFAHVHPTGSVPMAALALAQPEMASMHAMHMMHGMKMDDPAIPPVVSFPYGFPKAGHYRIFVQVKRAGRVETGIFDTKVTGPRS
jgi:hypothetical protein